MIQRAHVTCMIWHKSFSMYEVQSISLETVNNLRLSNFIKRHFSNVILKAKHSHIKEIIKYLQRFYQYYYKRILQVEG